MTKSKKSLVQVLKDTGAAEIIENDIKYEIAELMFSNGETIEKISKYTSIPVNELVEHFNTKNINNAN